LSVLSDILALPVLIGPLTVFRDAAEEVSVLSSFDEFST